MITPKLFEMSNPESRYRHFNITIDPCHFDFIRSLPYISSAHTHESFGGELMVFINDRYNLEDAWLDLYEQLSIETSKVTLDPIWGLDEEQES